MKRKLLIGLQLKVIRDTRKGETSHKYDVYALADMGCYAAFDIGNFCGCQHEAMLDKLRGLVDTEETS